LRFNPKSNVAPDDITNAYIAVVRSGVMPAWDELKQNTVLRADHLPWDESFGRILTDHLVRLIRMYFVNKWQGVVYQPSEENLRNAVATLAYAKKFNPVLEYLDKLEWDGVKRVEKLFSTYFNCGDDEYTRAVSICFTVGAVRRMRKPGCKFDTMPVLKSPQGWNKSTALKILFGAAFYSDADLGSLRDKDAAMKLRGIWVQEFAEIESLGRAEVGVLKAFVSRATDRQRDPYGHIVEDGPRRSVFAGTVNEGGYLKDSTGARRFWPLEVGKPIDIEKLAADRDQLWAEAAAMEDLGVSDVLPSHLWPMAGERQDAQTTADPWTAELRDFLDRRTESFKAHRNGNPDSDEIPLPPDRVHTSELFGALEIKVADQTKDKAQRLRVVMESSLGWHHNRGVRVLDRSSAGYTRERLASKVRRGGDDFG
jgi:predicted P-loop ATPase